jgi:hypothetical protein
MKTTPYRVTSLVALALSATIYFIGCTTFPQAAERFAVTKGAYSEKADLEAAAKQEFGPNATVADWAQIKATYGGSEQQIRDFCGRSGIPARESVYLLNNGQSFWQESRHYLMTRFDGNPPPNWLIHDQIQSYHLCLGSWHGNQPVLVRIRDDAKSASSRSQPRGTRGYPMTQSPDATVLFHGRLSDAQLIETLARAKGVQLPSGAIDSLASALGQRLGSSSCLVLRSRNVEKFLPGLATASLVVFWGRDVNFDEDVGLEPASAALLAVDRNNNLVLLDWPLNEKLLTIQERVKDKQLKFSVPIIQATK